MEQIIQFAKQAPAISTLMTRIISITSSYTMHIKIQRTMTTCSRVLFALLAPVTISAFFDRRLLANWPKEEKAPVLRVVLVLLSEFMVMVSRLKEVVVVVVLWYYF